MIRIHIIEIDFVQECICPFPFFFFFGRVIGWSDIELRYHLRFPTLVYLSTSSGLNDFPRESGGNWELYVYNLVEHQMNRQLMYSNFTCSYFTFIKMHPTFKSQRNSCPTIINPCRCLWTNILYVHLISESYLKRSRAQIDRKGRGRGYLLSSPYCACRL